MTYTAQIEDTQTGAKVRVSFTIDGVTYVVEKQAGSTTWYALRQAMDQAVKELNAMLKPLHPDTWWQPRMAVRNQRQLADRLQLQDIR